jgi:hypothetical protein
VTDVPPWKKMTDEVVRLGTLSDDFKLSIIRDLHRDHVVAFIEMQDVIGGPPRAQLLGSGTLVSAGKSRAILTAHHVLSVLPKQKERLVVLLERTDEPHSLDMKDLRFIEIAKGTNDRVGPDLGAVLLAPNIASAIAAKKVFYNMDVYRQPMLSAPPGVEDGLWVLDGFPDEGTTVILDGDGMGITTRFFGFGGFVVPEPAPDVNGFDYIECPVTADEAVTDFPRSWGGVSGGGLWQVQLKRQDGELVMGRRLLRGLPFFEFSVNGQARRVRCHGVRSLYERAYAAIAEHAH